MYNLIKTNLLGKYFPRSIFDEVYQAALVAGSGGIRWNATTKWVQLKSTDGQDNWIDYKYFDPNYTVTHDYTKYINTGTGTQAAMTDTIALSKRGMYCFTTSTYSGNISFSTTADTIHSFAQTIASTRTIRDVILYSDGTKSITYTTTNSGHSGFTALVYIGNYTNITNPQIYTVGDSTAQITQTYNTRNQFIYFKMCGNNRYARNFITTNIDSKYKTTWDPSVGNYYSAACINHNGTVTCTGVAGPTGGNVGSLWISSYVLVE